MPTTERDAVAPGGRQGAPSLVRLQAGTVASQAGEQLAALALAVSAYRAGGAAAVGLLAVVQLVPAAVLGPFAAVLGDRFSRERVVLVSDVVRGAATAGAALAVALGAPNGAVLPLAVALAVTTSAFHLAHTALLPLLVRSVRQLTSATATTSQLRSAVSLAAPVLGGVVLLRSSEAVLLTVAALAFWTAAGLAHGLPRTGALRAASRTPSVVRSTAQGLTAGVGDRATRLVLGLFLAHSAVRGAVGVLVVVLPVELLGWDSSSVGFVTALVGLGGLVGAFSAAPLARRRAGAGPLAVGLVLTGLPLVVAAALSAAPVVLGAVAVLGTGLTLVSTSSTTLLVRAVRGDLLTPVLGVLGTARAIGTAVGAGLVPLLVATAGLRWTLAGTGAALLAVLLVSSRGLRAVERTSAPPERELALLRGSDVFAGLPPVALERLAGRLEPREVAAGTAVVVEDDPADCVFLVAEGELVVEAQEAGGAVDRIGPGEVFGEMALLHDARRNATVRAATRCGLLRLTRDEFLAAVTGSPVNAVRTSDLVAARLAHRRGVVDGR